MFPGIGFFIPLLLMKNNSPSYTKSERLLTQSIVFVLALSHASVICLSEGLEKYVEECVWLLIYSHFSSSPNTSEHSMIQYS